MLGPSLAGLVAGLVHVLSGPDHLAAVGPLAATERRAAWRAGLFWGLGHSTGVGAVGLLALWVRDSLPIDALSSWSEYAVGFVLIAVGLWGLRRSLRRHIHLDAHDHGSLTHAHAHVHGEPALPGPRHRHAFHAHTHAALAVGVLHGLAGSSHLLGVLPALALPGFAASAAYLVAYGVGTVAGMTAFAGGLGLLTQRAGHGSQAARWLLSACSAAAVLVGVAWLGV
jgi:hypothetical protein